MDEGIEGNKLVDIQLVWTRVDESEHWYNSYLMKCQFCNWFWIADNFDTIHKVIEEHLKGGHKKKCEKVNAMSLVKEHFIS